MYTEPLYVPGVTIESGTAAGTTHNLLIVATENDSVFAFDADTRGPALWTASLLEPGESAILSSDADCSDLSPQIGITGTPVIDANTNILYVVAATRLPQSGGGVTFTQRLHAIDITTGLDAGNSPVVLSASLTGTAGTVTFNALNDNQRPALLLDNGFVYIATSSHCDSPVDGYQGWVLGYNASTLQQAAVYTDEINGSDGGIWMGGGGLAADTTGDLSTGNGVFDITGSLCVDCGDTFVHLAHATDRSLSVSDFFTPYKQASLSSGDSDFGSGGMLLLPEQSGPYPDLAIPRCFQWRISTRGMELTRAVRS